MRWLALVAVLMTAFSANAQSANEYWAACDFSKYSSYSYIQKITTPREWNDLISGKGKQMHEDGLGPYRIYESEDLQIVDTVKFDPQTNPTQVVLGQSRVPEAVDTKQKVVALFDVKTQMPYASYYSAGCDCHEVEFNFVGFKTTQVKIDYSSCI